MVQTLVQSEGLVNPKRYFSDFLFWFQVYGVKVTGLSTFWVLKYLKINQVYIFLDFVKIIEACRG